MAIDMDKLLAISLPQLREGLLIRRKPLPERLLKALEKDPRQGARHLALLLRKRKMEDRKEIERLRSLFRFERELWSCGFRLIAGVDEAGMAPLAGPVVAAAVILPRPYRLPGLNDSKQVVGSHKRDELANRIKQDAVCWSVGRAEVEEIDRLNIYQAGLLAMRRAVEGLGVRPDFLLVDARTVPHCGFPQRGVVHGDALSASIAAASLIAKTTRDEQMTALDRAHPGYGFASHKGYPTPEHLKALRLLGPLPIHRKSFAPVRAVSAAGPRQRGLFQDQV
jgi:ribonuclease HII